MSLDSVNLGLIKTKDTILSVIRRDSFGLSRDHPPWWGRGPVDRLTWTGVAFQVKEIQMPLKLVQ